MGEREPPPGFAPAPGMPPGCYVIGGEGVAGVFAFGPPPPIARWARVELMGYRLYRGRVSEVQFLGTTMGRVEVPRGRRDADGYETVFFRGEGVYAITLSDEAAVRAELFPESPPAADDPPFRTLPHAAIGPGRNPGYYDSDLDIDDDDLSIDPETPPL